MNLRRPEDTQEIDRLDPSLPRLNERAPDFEAETTSGRRTLQAFAGRWLVLFSHPADFTPVTPTDFIEFAEACPRFQTAGCELLGFSINTHFAFIAWMHNIREALDVDIPFPLPEDLSMSIARAYGMLQPGTRSEDATRATFVIDPSGVLRLSLHYRNSSGRSIKQMLQIVEVLQASDEERRTTTTPAQGAAGEAQDDAGPVEADWYFPMRRLPTA